MIVLHPYSKIIVIKGATETGSLVWEKELGHSIPQSLNILQLIGH